MLVQVCTSVYKYVQLYKGNIVTAIFVVIRRLCNARFKVGISVEAVVAITLESTFDRF